MKVLIDTSIWSLALRRKVPEQRVASELAGLLRNDAVALVGAVRQEVLSGIPDQLFFATVRGQLRKLPDYPLSTTHYERAAEIFNLCRSKGIQGSLADYLLCAVGELDRLPIYTSDIGFTHYAKLIRLSLYRAP